MNTGYSNVNIKYVLDLYFWTWESSLGGNRFWSHTYIVLEGIAINGTTKENIEKDKSRKLGKP